MADSTAELHLTDEETETENTEAVPRVADNEDGSKTIQLRRPYTHAKELVCEVTMRDIYGKDLKVMDQASGEIGKRLRLISQLSGLSNTSLDKMHASDVNELVDVVEGFLDEPKGGGSS